MYINKSMFKKNVELQLPLVYRRPFASVKSAFLSDFEGV